MRRAILAFVATVAGLVVLLSFKTASGKSTNRPVALAGTTPSDQTASSDNSAPSDNPAPAASSTPSSQPSQPGQSTPTPTQTPTKTAGTKTVTGSSVPVTEGFRTFGNVQVQVTVSNGKITKLVAVDYPNGDPRSYEISRYSIPVLGQEVLSTQGTSIDIVSGATYTTEAYAQSVQAALDKAKS
ncbi:MAG TPA: FMN-binding protein [Acidothermaceae bacterium]|nr:FMN-binding protein [Acidothermaceae bacterium]